MQFSASANLSVQDLIASVLGGKPFQVNLQDNEGTLFVHPVIQTLEDQEGSISISPFKDGRGMVTFKASAPGVDFDGEIDFEYEVLEKLNFSWSQKDESGNICLHFYSE